MRIPPRRDQVLIPLALLALVALVACGRDARPNQVRAGGLRTAYDGAPYLDAVLDGTIHAAVEVGVDGGFVLYGGYDQPEGGDTSDVTSGTWATIDAGVITGPEGIVGSFRAGLRLIDAKGTRVGDKVVIVGRRCDGDLSPNAGGFDCTPGTAAAVAVDLHTAETTPVPLPPIERDPHGGFWATTPWSVAGHLVLSAATEREPADAQIWVAAAGSTRWRHAGTMPSHRLCSTGSHLVWYERVPETAHATPENADRVIARLRMLDVASLRWSDPLDAPTITSPGLGPAVTCSAGHVTVVPSSLGTTPVDAVTYSESEQNWRKFAVPIAELNPWLEGDPASPTLDHVQAPGKHLLVDPSTGRSRTVTVPEHSDTPQVEGFVGRGRFGVVRPGSHGRTEVR